MMNGRTSYKACLTTLIFLVTSCSGGSSNTATTESDGNSQLNNESEGTNSQNNETGVDAAIGLPQVVRLPSVDRGLASIQTNLMLDRDFSVQDTVSDFVFSFEFTTGHVHEFQPIPNSTENFPNTFFGNAITNGTDKLFYFDTGYIGSSFNESDGSNVRITAIAFGDETYDWYATFITLPGPSLPQISDLTYIGGFLETYIKGEVDQVARGESLFNVDLVNNLLQLTLDDGLGQVLRGTDIAVTNGGFTGVLTDDLGRIEGVIEGQLSGSLGIAIGGVYSYVDNDGGRAAGVFNGQRQQ